jgi:aldehyde:ferredoxin oxidoreductase
VRERLGERYRVAAIGPAGERGVRYATLSAEGRHAGRGGTGAALGAKRLKAVAVAGENFPAPADSARLAALVAEWRAKANGREMARYRSEGTLATLADLERRGQLPARNFQRGAALPTEGLHAGRFAAQAGVTQALPEGALALETRTTDPDGRSARMEYENVFSLGPLCGIADRGVAPSPPGPRSPS